MNQHFRDTILKATGASSLTETELIQNLWSGYGKIIRIMLRGSARESVVIKHVLLPENKKHPRGWNTNISHERKLKSYKVEMAFYNNFRNFCSENCYIPECLALETYNDEVLMVLEDLDSSGFPLRKTNINLNEIKACLSWLANFHATFMGIKPDGLWEIGTYWHLDTRPDELEVLDDISLKNAARSIDEVLRTNKYQTIVHGDAKLANFCFSEKVSRVAAVDFQYVGGGCGMKDVAYFIGSCLYEDDCEELETELLDFYFKELKKVIKDKNQSEIAVDIEKEWRPLYAVAWTDFHRFMKGWSPGHWKIHSYSERLAREVVSQLNKE